MTNLFSVDATFVTILEYPLSYLEGVGTLLYLLSVYLIAKRNLLTWPIGIVSVILFMVLFYQIRLYSAALEQIYYLFASAYGWWYWKQGGAREARIQDVALSAPAAILGWLGLIALLSVGLGATMSQIHEWLPALFPEQASYPWIDALTTVASLVAMWLMARKRIESWIIWISVDCISIWMYFVKGVLFVSLLYVVLTVLAVAGLVGWLRAGRQQPVAASQAGALPEV